MTTLASEAGTVQFPLTRHAEAAGWTSVSETAALATIDRKLDYHWKKRAALNDLFQTLLHKLMTAEIRVSHLDIDTSEVVQPSTQGVTK